MASRIKEKESSVQRCAQLGAGARLKDNVHTIDSESGSTVAVLLHPFRPLLTSVDGVGTVRVHNYRHSTVINRFHISGAASAADCLLALLKHAGMSTVLQGIWFASATVAGNAVHIRTVTSAILPCVTCGWSARQPN